jgi:hypothetical protein
LPPLPFEVPRSVGETVEIDGYVAFPVRRLHGDPHPAGEGDPTRLRDLLDDLRARFARHGTAALVAGLACLRPRPGDVVGYATGVALREMGRRAQFLDSQLDGSSLITGRGARNRVAGTRYRAPAP